MASEGSERVLRGFARATLGRRSEDLLRLFSEECLGTCRGFRLVADPPRGGLHPYRWVPRQEPGGLADDLHGQLSLYEVVDRARLSFLALEIAGPGKAEALVALAVDGRLRGGALRSDRGTLRLALGRQADDSWRIEGFAVVEVRSVLSRAPLFSPPEQLSPALPAQARRGSTAPSDLASLDADQGAGLAVVDLDGDGDLDVFLPGPGLGRLLRNDGRLLPTPAIPGVSTSDQGAAALLGDLDGDGDPDLFVVASEGESRWLENRAGRLVVVSGSSTANLGPGTAAALLSSQGNGSLDLVFAPAPAPGRPAPAAQLFRRSRDGFRPVPGALPPGLVHTAALCAADLDEDGRTDLVHVSRLGPVTLLRNRSGRFEPMDSTQPLPILGRACTVADLDGDGRLDVAIAAVRSPETWKATLAGFPLPGGPLLRGGAAAALRARLAAVARGSFWLRNEGRGRFVRRSLASPASLGWDLAIAAEDLDGDGRAEVALGGGFHWLPTPSARSRIRPQDDRFFTAVLPRLLSGRPAPPLEPAQGSLGASRGATLLLGPPPSRGASPHGGHVDVGRPAGLELAPGVRALAWADLDRDGLPDLLVRRNDGALLVHRLKTPLGPGRTLTLRIGAGRSGAAPHGARVSAQGLERLAVAALDGGASDRPWGEVRLGLGSAARADRVEVRWPDGAREEWQDLDTGAAYTLHRGVKAPTSGLATHPHYQAGPPGPTPPSRKAGAREDPSPRPTPGDPPPPRELTGLTSLTVAGQPLAHLPELLVAPVERAAALGPRPLRAFLGKAGTVLYLPPPSCASCPTYLSSLSKAAPAWRRRGIAALVVNAPPGSLPRAGAPGLLALVFTGTPSPPGSLLGLLLVLDAAGRPRTIYVGSQPDPALLEHWLK